jgi:hypothetical protein
MLEHLDRIMRVRWAAVHAAAADSVASPVANPRASGLRLLSRIVYAPIPAISQPNHPAAYPPTLPAAAPPAQPPVLSRLDEAAAPFRESWLGAGRNCRLPRDF